jgi:hypothetical protein
MSKSLLLMLCLITGLLVLACTHAETNRNAAAPSAATSPAPAGQTNRNANANATAEKVGITECDTFLDHYETCVTGKVPEGVRAQFQTNLNTLRTQWKKLADNPQTRGTLAAACKTQRETTMAAMKAYNCTW